MIPRRDSRSECLAPPCGIDSKYVLSQGRVDAQETRRVWSGHFALQPLEGACCRLLPEKREVSSLGPSLWTQHLPSHTACLTETPAQAQSTPPISTKTCPNMTLKLASNLHLPEKETESQRCSVACSFGQSKIGWYTVETEPDIWLRYDDHKHTESPVV